jgi:hypothetical protein
MTNPRDLIQRLTEALYKAEAALSDIGDAEREPGDDVQWCEDRASIALPITRVALTEARAYLAQLGPDEPAVPDGREPISVVYEPSDAELLELMPEAMRMSFPMPLRSALTPLAASQARHLPRASTTPPWRTPHRPRPLGKPHACTDPTQPLGSNARHHAW